MDLLALLSNPETWIALLTLTVLEIVLGIDNVIFISILVTRLPTAQRDRARRVGLGLALPRYVEIERKGPDHAPVFTTEVSIDGKKPARGSGANKRAAEQAAASAMLTREGVLRGTQGND